MAPFDLSLITRLTQSHATSKSVSFNPRKFTPSPLRFKALLTHVEKLTDSVFRSRTFPFPVQSVQQLTSNIIIVPRLTATCASDKLMAAKSSQRERLPSPETSGEVGEHTQSKLVKVLAVEGLRNVFDPRKHLLER